MTTALTIQNNLIQNNLVQDWINFCDVKAETQKTYAKSIKAFVKFLSDNGVETPNRDSVINFRDSLLVNHSVATCRLYLSAVKMFVRWLSSKGICANFADNVKIPKAAATHTRDALTQAESKQVMQSFSGSDIKTLRDKAIVSLMLNCGLRSIEVVRLDCGDIEQRRGKIFVNVHGKARDGKVDKVQLPPQVYSLIKSYLQLRGKVQANSPLFAALSNRNKNARLQTQTISRLAKSTFRSVGIDTPRITCHSLRHTAATTMLLLGVEIAKVQRILRHRNPATTDIYRHDIDAFNNDGTIILANNLFKE